ncbi:MAG: hypothetical protein OHK0039_06950 [Bacteroidia bacterium]
MKHLLYFLPLLLLSLACQQGHSQGVPVLAPKAFQQGLKPGVQLLDVRTAGEYAQGRIAGSKQIDMRNSDFVAQVKQTFDPAKPVYIYCLSGIRSASAAKALRSAGFTQIYDLQGGLRYWSQAGLPITK